jgi:hypothetical protein
MTFNKIKKLITKIYFVLSIKTITLFQVINSKIRIKKKNYIMNLGVAYSLFDSEELLEYSIKSIRKNVDFVCIVWQKISNNGEKCNEGLEELLNRLVSEGLVDELYLYEPDIANTGGENASINETRKRNIGLELCRQHGCNYHMTIDADEFYTDEQFKFMKKEMEDGDYGTGYCQHIQYYYDSIYRLKYPERQFISTIEKIDPNTKYVYKIPCIVPIDPTRKTNNVLENKLSYRIFTRSECQMHHMSFVRKNIKKKLWNHSSKVFFTEESVDKIAEYYKNWKYPQKCMWAGEALLEVIKVPRQFEIYKIDDNQ